MSRGRRLVLGGEASERARKLGIGILQVLSGMTTPGEASEAMGISVNRYYQIEGKAVVAMLRALEPMPRGRRRSVDHELAALRKAKERAEREAARSLALVRASQKAMGFVPARKKAEDGKRRVRRPRVRARALIDAIEAAPEVVETGSVATEAGVP